MPYITHEMRAGLDPTGPCQTLNIASGPGELNFQITKLVDQYIDTWHKNYASINDVIGALECAKLEVYRRLAAPYEDKKCETNGDVYAS